MSIVGFKCPIGAPFEPGSEHSFDFCVKECPDPCLPHPILTSVAVNRMDDTRTKHPAGAITATGLLGCSAEWLLKAKNDIYVDADRMVVPWRGTMVHEGISNLAGPSMIKDWIIERTLLKEVDGIEVSGTPDAVDVEGKTIWDWKVIKDASIHYQPNDSHVMQLNIYRWLLAPEIQIDRLRVAYLTGNGIMTTPGQYPIKEGWKKKIIELPEIQVYDLDRIETFVKRQAGRLSALWDGSIPVETIGPEGPTMFNGKKCALYCDVNHLCPHYQEKK